MAAGTDLDSDTASPASTSLLGTKSGRTGAPTGRGFARTRWSVVLKAAQAVGPEAEAALASLCETYWFPLYAFVRRQGHPPHDAEDLTQAFFARLLERRYLDGLEREGGRFRSFLLTALKRFLANEWDRVRAAKRGGRRSIVSLDGESAESRYEVEPSHALTPDKVYERQWAQALLDRVMGLLRDEYARAGKAEWFTALSGTLGRPRGEAPYRELATGLGTTEAAVKMAVQRLRARYRAVLRAEVAHTVARPEEVGEEIRHLFTVFGG
ncbi:MAG: sigma-70 family RNA polymerase sigma factor [Verrucomicrobiales bacterium]|nr:sigma-70 family RNA polymerase sigma factor [Verrucomicrobiales bacterium]